VKGQANQGVAKTAGTTAGPGAGGATATAQTAATGGLGEFKYKAPPPLTPSKP